MSDVAQKEVANKEQELVTFDLPASVTSGGAYRHWKLTIDGRFATLALDVNEDGGLRPGYKLKLNSYDLGVDIELHNILQSIRFEHPEVACVTLTSGKEKIFCAGANIYMLGTSSHAWKVNFCKFTNETRNGMEDSSRHDGLRFLAALNGTTAGGGYELALACDEIVLIDDRSSAVSLPEVPLLGVLPGTGGLTRVVDKRHVRRDLADIFCTNPDGVRGDRAKSWGLVDEIAAPAQFAATVRQHAERLAATSSRPVNAQGIKLHPLTREVSEDGYRYGYVEVGFDRIARTAILTVRGPQSEQPKNLQEIVARGDRWWPLAMARELDDAILMLRANEPECGLLLVKTSGSAEAVLACGAALLDFAGHWLVRETVGLLRRTFARLDVSSRSMFALIEPGSCFAGLLFELALAADRSYMLAVDNPQTDEDNVAENEAKSTAAENQAAPRIAIDATNFKLFPTVTGNTRLATRFADQAEKLADLAKVSGRLLSSAEALAAGLITVAPDELDWEDELRMAIEERCSLSPDALTGMEASLRFPGAESIETKVFGRLSAWQNWVFIRPNSTGESGALKLFGTGKKSRFDWERV
jgi:benzoyl-CoA-dihydrodiol lyase